MTTEEHPSDHGHMSISKSRFEAFSDGVFAIAITLLVLEFRPPEIAKPTDASMAAGLLSMWPQFLVYAASFATIGIMWFNHYALFHNAPRVTYASLIANLVLLLLVCFLPFPTLLLGRYGLMPSLVAYYGLVLLTLSICFNVLYYTANPKPGERLSIVDFIRTRNLWNSVGLIAYAGGAILSFASPIVAVAGYTAVALYYMSPASVRAALRGASDR
jgi:uncharacterized membrane protein